jgi:long-subunit acyl-CoA synthetase (AMP-forming)
MLNNRLLYFPVNLLCYLPLVHSISKMLEVIMRVTIATYNNTHILSLVSPHTRKGLQKSDCNNSSFSEVT